MAAPPSQRIPRMPGPRNLIAILKRHVAPPAARAFAVDLGLAAGIFCAWLALCGFSPVVAGGCRRVAPGRENRPIPAPMASPRTGGHWRCGPASGVGPPSHPLITTGPSTNASSAQRYWPPRCLPCASSRSFDPLVYVFPFLTLLWSPPRAVVPDARIPRIRTSATHVHILVPSKDLYRGRRPVRRVPAALRALRDVLLPDHHAPQR